VESGFSGVITMENSASRIFNFLRCFIGSAAKIAFGGEMGNH
jgi:hypothetical protein